MDQHSRVYRPVAGPAAMITAMMPLTAAVIDLRRYCASGNKARCISGAQQERRSSKHLARGFGIIPPAQLILSLASGAAHSDDHYCRIRIRLRSSVI
jgi:hypothetical protein